MTEFNPQTLPLKLKAVLSQADLEQSDFVFRKGAVVVTQGDANDAIFYLQTGTVKLSATSAAGKVAVLAILGPGDFFGESDLLGPQDRNASVIAVTDIEVMRIKKSALLAGLHKNAEFAEFFIDYLLHRMRRAQSQQISQLYYSSEKQLACALLLMSDFSDAATLEVVLPNIGQETLAAMIGTTRARVSHFMTIFRKRGYITYGDEIRVHRSLLKVFDDHANAA